MGPAEIEQFIERWQASGAAERSNSQLFLGELCDLLEVPRPDPAQPDNSANAYVFDRSVPLHHGDGSTTTGFIDLYKRGCFVLESKQGVETESGASTLAKLTVPKAKKSKGIGKRQTPGWDQAMEKAKAQTERYVKELPAEEGRPPFVLVLDVGYSIELYSEFTMTGGTYLHFPDPQNHRIYLEDLRRPEVRDFLRKVWTAPLSLDPARRATKVTKEIAANLAKLAKSLEQDGESPEHVAEFLSRCMFTMFAEDVGLLPARGFSRMLEDIAGEPEIFKDMVEALWRAMKEGAVSSYLSKRLKHFNGYLFADAWALELDAEQVALLLQASKADWRDVEPAIFGTLLERALDPEERHKLGAHFTPRDYVERLVMPTIIAPLRAEWEGVKAAAFTLARRSEELGHAADETAEEGKNKSNQKLLTKARKLRQEAGNRAKEALSQVEGYHKRLCEIRVLDPACGSGNFLYVSMEHMKRLEGEIIDFIEQIDRRETAFELASGRVIDPHQFLGIEINPRAAAIAELVLWIGYLQWHFRTRGDTDPPEPIIKDFENIECRDAVLAWDEKRRMLDEETKKPITRWDGHTKKKSPVTGKMVPDQDAQVEVYEYLNPHKAEWPAADYVVGNPPFVGNKRMRMALGDEYVVALRTTYETVPESADYVMYWWQKAAELAKKNNISGFGLISTNSIRQTFNRRVVANYLNAEKPISLIYAVPDHPWVDSADGADVRISMTVGRGGSHIGILHNVIIEGSSADGQSIEFISKRGVILADLTIGPNVIDAQSLAANKGISNRGMIPHGTDLVVSYERATELGLGRIKGLERHIRPYINGKDLTRHVRGALVIDLFGLSEEQVE